MQQWLEQTLSDYSISSSKKKAKKADEKTEEGDRAFSKAETQAIQDFAEAAKRASQRSVFKA